VHGRAKGAGAELFDVERKEPGKIGRGGGRHDSAKLCSAFDLFARGEGSGFGDAFLALPVA
jgi:hypothetical protein